MVRLLCGQLVGDRNAHAAAGAGDHADGRLQVRRVQVGHFGAGDLLQLLLRDGRDLRLVGHAGTALDTDSLLDKDSRRGRLGDEAEGTVSVNSDDNGDDLPIWPLVRSLNSLVNAMMLTPFWPKAGPTGGAGVALPAGICSLM